MPGLAGSFIRTGRGTKGAGCWAWPVYRRMICSGWSVGIPHRRPGALVYGLGHELGHAFVGRTRRTPRATVTL